MKHEECIILIEKSNKRLYNSNELQWIQNRLENAAQRT